MTLSKSERYVFGYDLTAKPPGYLRFFLDRIAEFFTDFEFIRLLFPMRAHMDDTPGLAFILSPLFYCFLMMPLGGTLMYIFGDFSSFGRSRQGDAFMYAWFWGAVLNWALHSAALFSGWLFIGIPTLYESWLEKHRECLAKLAEEAQALEEARAKQQADLTKEQQKHYASILDGFLKEWHGIQRRRRDEALARIKARADRLAALEAQVSEAFRQYCLRKDWNGKGNEAELVSGFKREFAAKPPFSADDLALLQAEGSAEVRRLLPTAKASS